MWILSCTATAQVIHTDSRTIIELSNKDYKH